jgi:hypothetical protein
MVIFHPLVKVFIFPTSFSALPPLGIRTRQRALQPRQDALGSGIKLHYRLDIRY